MNFNMVSFKDCPFCGKEMVGFTRFNCEGCSLEWQGDDLIREITNRFNFGLFPRWVDLPEGILVVKFEVPV